MHGHLPFLISRLGAVVRHASHLYHSASRMVELGFYSLPVPGRKRAGITSTNRRPLANTKPLLIHYHIFKNAGTSFEVAVQNALGRKRSRICDASTPDGIVSAQELAQFATRAPELSAIFSHHAVLPPPRVRGRAVLGTILIRDPIARIRSIYAFERLQESSSAGARKAKELDFKGYVQWRLSCSPAMFCSYQVYFCSRGKETRHEEICAEAHFERAIENMDRVKVVGTVERYTEWLALVQSVLSDFYPNIALRVMHENATSTTAATGHAAVLNNLVSELGPELSQRLLECNQLDMRLHQVADAALTRHLAQRRVEIALLGAYARVSQSLMPAVDAENDLN